MEATFKRDKQFDGVYLIYVDGTWVGSARKGAAQKSSRTIFYFEPSREPTYPNITSGNFMTMKSLLEVMKVQASTAYETPVRAERQLKDLTEDEFGALSRVFSQLSPENLTCDGELSRAQVRTRYADLMRQRANLVHQYNLRDAEVTEDAAWEELLRRQQNKTTSQRKPTGW
jgi:hypothetical protein